MAAHLNDSQAASNHEIQALRAQLEEAEERFVQVRAFLAAASPILVLLVAPAA